MLVVDPGREHGRSAVGGDGDLAAACPAYRRFSRVPGGGHRPQSHEQFQRVLSGSTRRARRGARLQPGAYVLNQPGVALPEHDVLEPPGGQLDGAQGAAGERGAKQGRHRRRAGRHHLAYLDPGAGRARVASARATTSSRAASPGVLVRPSLRAATL